MKLLILSPTFTDLDVNVPQEKIKISLKLFRPTFSMPAWHHAHIQILDQPKSGIGSNVLKSECILFNFTNNLTFFAHKWVHNAFENYWFSMSCFMNAGSSKIVSVEHATAVDKFVHDSQYIEDGVFCDVSVVGWMM